MLLGAVSTWAQTAPTIQWQTTVPEVVSTPSLSLAVIANAPNGEYQAIISLNGTNSTLVRLTSTGQFKVARALPGSIDKYQANQLISTQDGGFLLSGNAVRDGFNIRDFITKLDAQGNTVWNTIPDPIPVAPAVPPTTYRNTFLLERPNNFVKFTNIGYRIVSSAFRQHFDKSGREISFKRTPLDNVLAFAPTTDFVSDITEAVDGGILVAFGGGTTPPVVTPPTSTFAVLAPGYDCNTGQLTAQVANVNGSVEYRIIGLRDWSGSNNFSVPSYQRTNTTFEVESRTSLGAYTTADFTTACGTTPPVVIPPVTPPTGTALRFEMPAFFCETGLLRLITSGGDGTLVEYRARTGPARLE